MLLDIGVVLTPFFLLFGGVLLLRKTVLWSASLTLLSTILLFSFFWQMRDSAMLAAFVKASAVTFDISLILLGALFLLAILKQVGAIQTLKRLCVSISPDRRIQAILIGIFFVGFIEGVAGFGTPAMLAAPLLVVIGFPVSTAILITLFGNSLSVPFGAVGTPYLIGVAQGVAGFDGVQLTEIIRYQIMLSAPIALFAPLAMSTMLTHSSGKSWQEGLGIWKQALLAGICFVLPVSVIALTAGPEFPSLVGSLVGGILFILGLRLPMFKNGKNWDFPVTKHSLKQTFVQPTIKNSIKAITPYIAVVTLLIITRLSVIPFQSFTQNTLSYTLPSIAEEQVTHVLQPLYSPGLYLLIGSLIAIILYRPSQKTLRTLSTKTIHQAIRPILTLLLLITFAQLLLYSGSNSLGKENVPEFLAEVLSQIPLPWTVLAPFIGLFGSLVTGSVTISNVLFSEFQARTAILGGYDPHLILALQMLGASAGNMIALHNIIAVIATIGTTVNDREILVLLLKPALLFAITVGLMGSLALLFMF